MLRALSDESLRTRVGAAGRLRTLERFTWPVTARLTAEQYRVLLEERHHSAGVGERHHSAGAGERHQSAGAGDARAGGRAGRGPPTGRSGHSAPRRWCPVLTVDFERLGLRAGERILDLGCGAGRHAFECLRRGASVVAFDSDAVELKEVAALMAAMEEAGEVPSPGTGTALRGTALALPFADASFDRVIAAEVLEHIGGDVPALRELSRVLRPGGRIAVTVPRYGPELVNWALSEQYHTVPGGHIRIYRRSQLVARLGSAGLRVWWAPIMRTLSTALTGGCAAPSGLTTSTTRGYGPITGCSCGTSSAARFPPGSASSS